MAETEFEGEISVSAQLTENGITASARSRLLSALDWVGASYVASKFRSKAQKTLEEATVAKGRVAIIDAAAQLAVERMKFDPAMAEAVIQAQFGTMFAREQNKAAALESAVSELESDPPSEEQSAAGPEHLSEDMLNRWGRYAEDASSDDLRQRWGRVLAAEIRKPGTFSAKVLRTVDELDAETAALFETFCADAIDGAVPRCIRERPLNFAEQSRMVEAGLLFDPTAGHVRLSQDARLGDGQMGKMFVWGAAAIILPANAEALSSHEELATFQDGENGIVIPIYLMTEVGKAISSILPQSTSYPFGRLFVKCVNSMKAGRPIAYFRAGENTYRPFPVQPI